MPEDGVELLGSETGETPLHVNSPLTWVTGEPNKITTVWGASWETRPRDS